MEATSKRRETLSWPDEDKTHKQLEAIYELAKELRTDYPTDTPDEPTNWSNEARNRRNAYIRAQFLKDENGVTLHLLTGPEWLELFDMLGFSVDKETRKRFASHLNWYSFWYANFKPRLSSKYAQRIHWYVYNFLFCLRNKLQTEKDYREGKYDSKGQTYFMEIEKRPVPPTETPQISTETAETANVSMEGENMTEKAICAFISKAETTLNKIKQKCLNREIYVEDASRYEFMVCMAVSNFVNKYKNDPTEPPQSPKTPETAECITEPHKLAHIA